MFYDLTGGYLPAFMRARVCKSVCASVHVRMIHTPCPSSLTLMLCSKSLMIWAACSQRSGGPLMWAILSGPVPSSVRKI